MTPSCFVPRAAATPTKRKTAETPANADANSSPASVARPARMTPDHDDISPATASSRSAAAISRCRRSRHAPSGEERKGDEQGASQRSRAMATARPRTTRCQRGRGTPVDDQRHLPRAHGVRLLRTGTDDRHGPQPVVVPREHVPMPDQAPMDTRRGHGVGAIDDACAPGSRRSGVGLDPHRREAQERLTEQSQDDDDAGGRDTQLQEQVALQHARLDAGDNRLQVPRCAPGSRSRASRT